MHLFIIPKSLILYSRQIRVHVTSLRMRSNSRHGIGIQISKNTTWKYVTQYFILFEYVRVLWMILQTGLFIVMHLDSNIANLLIQGWDQHQTNPIFLKKFSEFAKIKLPKCCSMQNTINECLLRCLCTIFIFALSLSWPILSKVLYCSDSLKYELPRIFVYYKILYKLVELCFILSIYCVRSFSE